MRLTFASYNIHKAVGLDRRRDPERILAVLREIDADVIALQEVDRRFGDRASVIPRQLLDDYSPWQVVAPRLRPDSLGWHGNALLVRRGITVTAVEPVILPALEPRGAICATLELAGQPIRVVGMHLDLSGLRRRHQMQAVLAHLTNRPPTPAVLMGDLNEWSRHGGCLRAVSTGRWRLLEPGRSFPSRRPLAMLDRLIVSSEWRAHRCGVHHSGLAARASDHLPVFADLALPHQAA